MSAHGEVAREFIGGCFDGEMRAIYGLAKSRVFESLEKIGTNNGTPVYAAIYFGYVLYRNRMICVQAATTKEEVEAHIQRVLSP